MNKGPYVFENLFLFVCDYLIDRGEYIHLADWHELFCFCHLLVSLFICCVREYNHLSANIWQAGLEHMCLAEQLSICVRELISIRLRLLDRQVRKIYLAGWHKLLCHSGILLFHIYFKICLFVAIFYFEISLSSNPQWKKTAYRNNSLWVHLASPFR